MWLKGKNRKLFYRGIEVLCYLAVIAYAVFALNVFKWGRRLHWGEEGYVADEEVLSALGDFLSGTLGCLIAAVSMYLLFRALMAQLAANHRGAVQMETQRFNDLFFRLLDLTRTIADRLVLVRQGNENVEISGSSGVQPLYMNSGQSFTGVDFFNEWRSELLRRTEIVSGYDASHVLIMAEYHRFFDIYRDLLGAYFRTVYRILDLIETASIPDNEKRTYSKILRAQLAESELFFMFYNCQTTSGRGLARYLWRYNILKHLRVTDLVEFRDIRDALTSAEIDEINSLYATIFHLVRDSENKKELGKKTLSKSGHFEFIVFSRPAAVRKKRSALLTVFATLIKRYDAAKYPNFAAKEPLYWFRLMINISRSFEPFNSDAKINLKDIAAD